MFHVKRFIWNYGKSGAIIEPATQGYMKSIEYPEFSKKQMKTGKSCKLKVKNTDENETGRSTVMGRAIAIANQKGGVGKSTTAINLSSCLGAMGQKVLTIDLDPQGNTTSGLGVDKDETENTVYELLLGECEVEDCLQKLEFEGVSLIPSNVNLAGAEIELISIEDKEYILQNKISKIRDQFDFIIIDCPPSLNMLTINAMTTANTVLVPIQCEYYALEGLSQLMNTVRRVKRQYNETLDLEGVLLTMYDGRLNLTQQVVEEVKKYFPKKVYTTVIPRTVRLSEAPSFGKPIQYYDKNAKGAVAYNALAEEVLKQNA